MLEYEDEDEDFTELLELLKPKNRTRMDLTSAFRSMVGGMDPQITVFCFYESMKTDWSTHIKLLGERIGKADVLPIPDWAGKNANNVKALQKEVSTSFLGSFPADTCRGCFTLSLQNPPYCSLRLIIRGV